MAIWITSDLHLNDPHILKHCHLPVNTLQEYNNYIIQNYNKIVKKDDLVYILGDLGFKPKKALSALVSQLHGRKILIIGNHDQLTDSEYQSMGIIQVIRHPVYYSDHIILSHIPVKEAFDNPYVYNLHGHLHNGQLVLKNYYNVNCDIHEYQPIDLKELSKQINQEFGDQNRFEPFGYEWYSKFEKHLS